MGFDSRPMESFVQSVHTTYGGHPAPCPVDTVVELSFGQGIYLTTHLTLVPRLKIVGFYLHSLLCL
jgi:hypothetical protein